MVPNGWVVKNLDSIYRVIDSLHQTPSFSKDGEYRMVRVTDIKGKNLDLSNAVRVSKEVFLEYTKKYKPKRNDILFSRVGSYGISSFVDTDQEFCLGQNTVIAESNDQANPIYIFNVLKSEGIRRQVEKTVDGSSHKTVSLKVIKYLKIPLAPRKEQNKIAQILSTWDQAISATEKLLENSQQQKKALMQELLTGRKRFIDENGQFFNSEWLNLAVNQIGRVVTGSTPPKDQVENYGGEFGWATAEDFKGKYINDTKIQLSEIGMRKARLLSKGAVLVTCIASIGKNAIANKEMATNQQINAVEINEFNSNEFFYYLIEFSADKLRALAGTTAVAILNKSTFEKIKFQMPPLQEQRKIAQVISIADQEIETLQKKLDCLKQEKKALMQQLLTGKKRVKVAA